jgi:hypothetical protein
MSASRRNLEFTSLEEVVADLQNLNQAKYQSAGNWNLSQVAGHLEQWIRFPMEGFPRSPFPISLMLNLMRWTIGKSQLRKILREKRLNPGSPTIPTTVMPADAATDQEAVDRLLKTIERLKSYQGPLHPSPLFGMLDRETMLNLQLVHCAHHLSFLVPTEAVGDQAPAASSFE